MRLTAKNAQWLAIVITKCFHWEVLAAEFDKYNRSTKVSSKETEKVEIWWDLLDGLASQLEEEKYTTGKYVLCALS